MKHPIRLVGDLGTALRELEPQIRDPRPLRSGRADPKFGLRPREFLGNWLLCVVLAHTTGRDWTFCGDPLGGDGALLDQDLKVGFQVEHVYVPPGETASVEEAIAIAIAAKAAKGPAYARGRTLVVFNEAEGVLKPDRVATMIHGAHEFEAVWALGLEDTDGKRYDYWVARLLPDGSQVWRVTIGDRFDSWIVASLSAPPADL